MFRHNRNETAKKNNIRLTAKELTCYPGCEGKSCADKNTTLSNRDDFVINPDESVESRESFDVPATRNSKPRNSNEGEFIEQFMPRAPVYQPEFRATQITRIQTRIMDEDDEEECMCINDNGKRGMLFPSANVNMLKATPGMEAHLLNFTKDSMLITPNLGSDRNSLLPQFADNDNKLTATSAPFKPKRAGVLKGCDKTDEPGGDSTYMTDFGNLVAKQLDRLETQFIVYKVKISGSKSLKAFLLNNKYLLLSIPVGLFLLYLVLLLGVLIGSVFCNGMEDCPWTQGTTMAPRFLYSPNSVF